MKFKDLVMTKGPVLLPVLGTPVVWAGGYLVGKAAMYLAVKAIERDKEKRIFRKKDIRKEEVKAVKGMVIGGGVSIAGAGMIGAGVGIGQANLKRAYEVIDSQNLVQRETKDGVVTEVSDKSAYTFVWMELTDETVIEELNWLKGAEFFLKAQIKKHGYVTLDTISDSVGKARIPGGAIKGISTKKAGSVGDINFKFNEIAEYGLINLELTVEYDGVIANFM